ncbi:MAG: hypothetical protein U9P44_01490, partial [archaeon]|nr:hypothetical protein [archaeon]
MDKVKIIDKNKKTEDQTNDQDNKTAKNSNRSDKKDQNTIVLPGEELIESLDFLAGHGTYREDTKIYSKVVGLLRKKDHVISVIPLSG